MITKQGQLKTISISIIGITVVAFWASAFYFLPILKQAKKQPVQLCNVQAIKLDGEMYTSVNYDDKGVAEPGAISSSIEQAIAKANSDKNVKAIIIDIDSGGGDPVAGEEVANALKHSAKPTVALIRSQGTSAAYWAATGANRIFASLDSYVGSIGATASYVDNSIQDKQNGLTFNSLSSGQFKDMLGTDKPLTDSERALVMQGVNLEKENFVTAIVSNRNLDRTKIEALADGSAIFGQSALGDGLIDQIGGINEVNDYLEQKIGTGPTVCW